MNEVDWVDIFTRKEYCYDIIDSFKYCQENKGLVINAWCILSSPSFLESSRLQTLVEGQEISPVQIANVLELKNA